jgi:hypothetical protein
MPDLKSYFPYIYGIYISYSDLWMEEQLSTNQTITISFPVNIAYCNLIFFKNFHQYVNFIIGELELNTSRNQYNTSIVHAGKELLLQTRYRERPVIHIPQKMKTNSSRIFLKLQRKQLPSTIPRRF